MPRADLLALTPDDLASVVNRGVVKRAERELAAGEPSFRIDEVEGGELTVVWSDGVVCRFPAGGSLHDAVCSSGVLGVTRHVVRSVLAYQQKHAAGGPPPAVSGSPQGAAAENAVSTPDSCESVAENAGEVATEAAVAAFGGAASWDPGAIDDAELAARFRPAAVEKARKRFEQGVLVELVRGAKPTARFLDEPCTLRFMVPHDLRYLSADCAEAALPTFAMLAVWAFRRLPADQAAGVVAVQLAEPSTPTALLDATELLLLELAAGGFAGASPAWPQQWARQEDALREAGLVWPAELAADLLEQHGMYAARDARFDPVEAVDLVGELLARLRAVAGKTTATPQLLIRGSRNDRAADIAGGRMIGLGLGVRTGRRTTTLCAYLQDSDSGATAAVERSFAEPAAEEGGPAAPTPTKSFTELAATVLFRGASLGGLASSQLLLKSGKRTPSGRLILPRTAASLTVNPQAFAWEQLKPPAAVECFSQVSARLETLPPSYLRPRRVTENLHICAVAGVDAPTFDPASQKLAAVLHDPAGGRAELVHPFHARAAAGFEALAATLERRAKEVRFVCGRVSRAGKTLVLQPVCLVLDDGRRRSCLQPWIAAAPEAPSSFSAAKHGDGAAPLPREAFLESLRFELSELLLSGLRRSDARCERNWAELAEQGRRVGFVRLAAVVERLASRLALKKESPRWDPTAAAQAALDLCLVHRAAAEVV